MFQKLGGALFTDGTRPDRDSKKKKPVGSSVCNARKYENILLEIIFVKYNTLGVL